MGQLKLSHRNKAYKQGYFYPKHPEKLLGNHKYAIYRSGLELSYFRILDANPQVIRWGSEEVIIPYFFENKWHKYYVDLVVLLQQGPLVKKLFIELKPYSQTQMPKNSPRRKQKNYLRECYEWNKNNAKWASAKQFAIKLGCEFHILTEKDIQKN